MLIASPYMTSYLMTIKHFAVPAFLDIHNLNVHDLDLENGQMVKCKHVDQKDTCDFPTAMFVLSVAPFAR